MPEGSTSPISMAVAFAAIPIGRGITAAKVGGSKVWGFGKKLFGFAKKNPVKTTVGGVVATEFLADSDVIPDSLSPLSWKLFGVPLKWWIGAGVIAYLYKTFFK